MTIEALEKGNTLLSQLRIEARKLKELEATLRAMEQSGEWEIHIAGQFIAGQEGCELIMRTAIEWVRGQVQEMQWGFDDL